MACEKDDLGTEVGERLFAVSPLYFLNLGICEYIAY